MTTTLFTSIELFRKQLATARRLLDKGAAHVASTGGDAEAMLDWRLIDDMAPLRFQLMAVCNFARAWPARVAGLPVPAEVTVEGDVASFRAAIDGAAAYLDALTPEQFADRDDVPLTHELGTGMAPTLPSGRWLSGFAATNLYFHLSIAYAILRARGVPLGKVDLFAGGL